MSPEVFAGGGGGGGGGGGKGGGGVAGQFDGTDGTDWETPNNWDDNLLPSIATPTVVIDGANYGGNAPVIEVGGSSWDPGTVNMNNGQLTCNGSLTVTASFGFTGSSNLIVNGGTVRLPGLLTVPNTARVDLDGGTLRLDGGLTVQSGGVLDITGGTLDVADLTIESGGSVVCSGGTLNVSGNWDNQNATFTRGTSTVIFDGGGAQSISHSGGTETFYNVTIDNNSTVTLNPHVVINNVTIADGSTLEATAAKNITVGGDWANQNSSGSTGFTKSTSTVIFDKTGAQAVSQTGGTEAFHNVTLSNSSSLSLNSHVSLNELVIGNGATLIGGAAKNITIAENWTNNNVVASAGFTAGSSTVIFSKAGAQAVSQTGGTETFYNLTLTSTSNLTVNPHVEVNNLTIGDGATLIGSATKNITVGGNWNNLNSVASTGYNSNTSAVIFNNGGPQSISQAGGKEEFYNLSVANGANTLSLNTAVDVLNNLDFTTAGYIDLGTYDLKMVNWVDGRIPNLAVDRSVIAAGGGSFVVDGVDVGEFVPAIVSLTNSSTGYARVDISNLDGAANEFSVNLCNAISTDGSCGGGTAHTDSVVNLTWFINSASTDCGLTFYWDASRHTAGFDKDSLAISHYSGGKWTWITDTVQATLYSGTVWKASGVTDGFSPFGVGAADLGAGGPGPLPVELVSVGVEEVYGDVNVTWVTASEINNDYFVVEKSEDGVDFIELDEVQGAGNSYVENEYRYIDFNVDQGKTYYRIKQVDFDGTFTYSQVVFYESRDQEVVNDVILYPNPMLSGESAKLKITAGGDFEVHLYDVEGKQLFVANYYSNTGESKFITLPTSSLYKGIYFVSVVGSSEMETVKLQVR